VAHSWTWLDIGIVFWIGSSRQNKSGQLSAIPHSRNVEYFAQVVLNRCWRNAERFRNLVVSHPLRRKFCGGSHVRHESIQPRFRKNVPVNYAHEKYVEAFPVVTHTACDAALTILHGSRRNSKLTRDFRSGQPVRNQVGNLLLARRHGTTAMASLLKGLSVIPSNAVTT
jgi:hypothetical protein